MELKIHFRDCIAFDIDLVFLNNTQLFRNGVDFIVFSLRNWYNNCPLDQLTMYAFNAHKI